MSSEVFEQSWQRLVDGWPLHEVYGDDLKRALRDAFWFEWAIERPAEELFERAESLSHMFEYDESWISRTPQETAAIIIKTHQGSPEGARISDGHRWPQGSMTCAGVGYAMAAICRREPERLSAEMFSGHEDLQGTLGYVRWERGEIALDALSDEALAILAYRWLTDSRFNALDDAAALTSSARWTEIVRAVVERHAPVKLVWSRAKPLYGSLDLALTLDIVQESSFPLDQMAHREAFVRELFEPHLDVLPSQLAERISGTRKLEILNVQVMVLVLADMVAARDIPRPQALHALVLECMSMVNNVTVLPMLRRALEVDATGVDEALERAVKNWYRNLSLDLVDLYSSPPQALWREVITHVVTSYSGYSYNGRGYNQSLALIEDAFFFETVHELWQNKAPSKESGVITLEALDARKHAGAAPVYVLALGHKSKPVRERAYKALLALGEPARPVLEAHKDAKKKAVREACQEALAALGEPGSNELSADELEERERKRERLEWLLAHQDKIVNFVASISGDAFMSWFEVMSEIFVDRVPEHGVCQMVRITLHEMQHEQPLHLEMWSAHVLSLASIDNKMDKYDRRSLMDPLKRSMPGAIASEVLAPALTSAAGTMALDLLEVYLELVSEIDAALLVQMLEHGSKPVRVRAFESMKKVFSLADAQRRGVMLVMLAPLLDSKRGHTRELAAQIFAQASAEQLAPHVNALSKARDRERSAGALDALDAALGSAGQSSASVDASTEEITSWSQAEALLESQRARKVPGFITLDGLPALCWAETQKPLSEKALEALLTTLRQEGPDSRDEVARQVRPYLDDASAHAFSIELKDQWMRSGASASHKWAPYQQGIFVTAARLDEFGPHLADWVSAGRHHWAKWYMDVLARHGSRTGRSWVVYWALNAEHRSLHEHAKSLVAELAAEAGVSPGELSASVNLYIAQDAYEASLPRELFDQKPGGTLANGEVIEFVLDDQDELVVKRANDKLQKSLPKDAPADIKDRFKALRTRVKRLNRAATSHLEECMISARPWSPVMFETLFLEHPIMSRFTSKLLFILESGELFHVDEGDIVNVEWEPMALPEDAAIRIAHVFDLNGKSVERWLAHMGEGEVVQPFTQLDRAFFTHGEEPEIGEVSLATLAGRLVEHGWRHGRAEDAGMVYSASKIWPGRGVRVVLSHDGIYAGNPGMYKDLSAVRVDGFWDMQGNRLRNEDVDAVAYSETWVALRELTR